MTKEYYEKVKSIQNFILSLPECDRLGVMKVWFQHEGVRFREVATKSDRLNIYPKTRGGPSNKNRGAASARPKIGTYYPRKNRGYEVRGGHLPRPLRVLDRLRRGEK